MTTQSWSTVLDHSSDAGFRAWGVEFATKLAAAGLVQTADTGQINWVTVLRPAVNTDGGYEIWRMNDAQQASAPVFLRIAYGTGTNAAMPRMQFTFGTASNGTGTITGTALTTARTAGTGIPASTVTAYQSYLCVTAGFFGFAWKVGSTTANVANHCLLFARSVDGSGVATATGATIIWGAGTNSTITAYQFLRYAATAAAYTARTVVAELPTCVAGVPSSSLVGSDNQAYLHWMAVPQVLPVLGFCTIVRSEVATGSTFSATLVGSTAHTYIAIGQPFPGEPSATTTYGPAMLWE